MPPKNPANGESLLTLRRLVAGGVAVLLLLPTLINIAGFNVFLGIEASGSSFFLGSMEGLLSVAVEMESHPYTSPFLRYDKSSLAGIDLGPVFMNMPITFGHFTPFAFNFEHEDGYMSVSVPALLLPLPALMILIWPGGRREDA